MDEHFDEAPQTVQDYLRVLLRDVRDIKTQTTKTNGRVSELEGWRATREAKEREQAAFKKGASTALITKKQVAALGGFMTAAAGVGTAVVGLALKVAT